MARLIVGALDYALPEDADLDGIIETIATAMTERRGVAIAVRGEDGQTVRVVLNGALVAIAVVDTGTGGSGGVVTRGGRISG